MMLCPSCAAQTPPVVWSLIAGFVALPLVIVAVVALSVAGAVRRRRRDG
jgi:hypothetical protein